MIIAVDFDGTCVTHEFPRVGKDTGAAPVLKKLTDNGHKLILYTMRSRRREGAIDVDSDELYPTIHGTDVLQDAIDWFMKNDIPLYGINVNPTQKNWTDSPKPYAHLYIDDAALGIPLKRDGNYRPYVDWVEVEKMLKNMGYFRGKN